MLSRFVALSVSLIQSITILQDTWQNNTLIYEQ